MNQEIEQQYQKYIKVSKTPKTGKTHFKVNVYMGKSPLTGESIKHRGTFDTYKEAVKDCNKALKDKQDGTYNAEQDRNYKFKDLYKLWIEDYKDNVEESTLQRTTTFFRNHINKDIGNVYIKKLTPLMCRKVTRKYFENYSHSTANIMFVYIKRCLEYAKNLDLIDSNPMDKVSKPKKKPTRKKLQFYNVDELKRFLSFAEKDSFKKFVLFRLLSFSGMRIGELLALQWSDIDFTKSKVNITKTVTTGKHSRLLISTPKTPAGYREIPLDGTTMQYLKQWQSKQRHDLVILNLNPLDSGQLVFPNRSNSLMRINIVDVWNRKIAKQAGLKHIKVHGFRHTHATILFETGATPKEIQTRLGHSNVSITMDVYTHLTPKKEAETVNKFSKIMGI